MGILTLVRHGQASFEALDYDALTLLGAAQAAQTGLYFVRRKMVFDRILSGPLQRQRQTVAEIVHQMPVVCEAGIVNALQEFAEPSQIMASAARLRHRSGSPDAGIAPAEKMLRYGAAIQAWADGDIALEGALSSADFVRRVAAWFDQIVGEPQRARRTLAVTSAGVIAACMVRHFGLPASRLSEFAAVIRNCSVTEFVFTENRCSLLGFNNTTHLSDELMSAM